MAAPELPPGTRGVSDQLLHVNHLPFVPATGSCSLNSLLTLRRIFSRGRVLLYHRPSVPHHNQDRAIHRARKHGETEGVDEEGIQHSGNLWNLQIQQGSSAGNATASHSINGPPLRSTQSSATMRSFGSFRKTPSSCITRSSMTKRWVPFFHAIALLGRITELKIGVLRVWKKWSSTCTNCICKEITTIAKRRIRGREKHSEDCVRKSRPH